MVLNGGFPCPEPGCHRKLATKSGLGNHLLIAHGIRSERRDPKVNRAYLRRLWRKKSGWPEELLNAPPHAYKKTVGRLVRRKPLKDD